MSASSRRRLRGGAFKNFTFEISETGRNAARRAGPYLIRIRITIRIRNLDLERWEVGVRDEIRKVLADG